MQWIHDYQLYLFDFDGLLVNTEELHFQAYKRMCSARGYNLDWDFDHYCTIAHYDAHLIKNTIYAKFPQLYKEEPNWDVLYSEKKAVITALMNEGAIQLMPGVHSFLKTLEEAAIARCVVTHSPLDLINLVREQNPILNTIPYWITRENYSHPKPHPECYLKAIDLYAKPEDKVIGFEDTPRGLTALLETRATPILICKTKYPEIPSFLERGVLHYSSLLDLF